MSPTYRRRMGLLLGAGLGLVYSLVAQTINAMALPGVPLYQPPPGPAICVVMSLIGGALLGWVCAWPENSLSGIVWSGSLGALGLFAMAWLNAPLNAETIAGLIFLVLYTLLPMTALLAIGLGGFRWSLNALEQAQARAARSPQWLIPLGLLTLAGILGSFSLYPPEARLVLTRMNTLLQVAPDQAGLPAPFQADALHRMGRYTLEWENSDLDRFPIPRPASYSSEQSVVIVRFESGLVLVCLFPTARAGPTCVEY